MDSLVKALPKNPKVLAIIPARGGSKSIPYKNIIPLAGKPLIYYTIREAFLATKLDWFIVSTDDEKIAAVAKKYHADVPFLRPKKYAQDNTLDLPVFKHALKWLEKKRGWKPEIILNLRPTAPLRRAEEIDKCIDLIEKTGCDNVKSVIPAFMHPHKIWWFDKNNKLTPVLKTKKRILLGPDLNRQRLRPAYWQDGYIDITRRKFILYGKNNNMFGKDFRGFIRDPRDTIDLDTLEDYENAKNIIINHELKLQRDRRGTKYDMSSFNI